MGDNAFTTLPGLLDMDNQLVLSAAHTYSFLLNFSTVESDFAMFITTSLSKF